MGWAYKRGVGDGGGGVISGWAYKRNKKNVSERRDKTYLRNELTLTHHYISSYIIIHILCVTINGEFISKTSIKPTFNEKP